MSKAASACSDNGRSIATALRQTERADGWRRHHAGRRHRSRGRSSAEKRWGASIFMMLINPAMFGCADEFRHEAQWLSPDKTREQKHRLRDRFITSLWVIFLRAALRRSVRDGDPDSLTFVTAGRPAVSSARLRFFARISHVSIRLLLRTCEWRGAFCLPHKSACASR